MSDFMKALDKYMAENADLEQAIETINKMAEALQAWGKTNSPYKMTDADKKAFVREATKATRAALKLAEPYIRGK
jgi:methionyl-tRNA synthetase